MDKRGWLWKRKSSDKQILEKAIVSTADSSVNAIQIYKGKQDKNGRKPKHIQIAMDSYTHLTGLEDRVKSYEEQILSLEDEVKELNEKLSEAHSEITDKENLVKQHAKVAEDAISGWEKAEAEAETLKNDVESVTLLKLTAEDKASHLDDALKQCMRQIRVLKEEHDQKLQEVVLNKTKLFDKMKHELEAQIRNLEQELRRSDAESAALSRSLQERSNMLIILSEEKSQAEAEIERLRCNIQSCEKDINSLKYELHVASKEVEIRNEEKNMSVRSAEVANRQHLEGVKKIAKLEAECQRLRGLVKKKLPGPAAMAQMKLEVENMGRDYGDYRVRRSSVKPNTTDLSHFPLDNSPRHQKEKEELTERLLAMDEEMRMLKEVLTKRNSELHSSKSICAEMASKLRSLEAHLQANGEQRSPSIANVQVLNEGFSSRKASIPPTPTSRFEDGSDDNVSCAGSWATVSMSEHSYIQKELKKSEKAKKMELMDDFLEMEKLACLSHASNGTVSSNMGITGSEPVKVEASLEVTNGTVPQSEHGFVNQMCSKGDATSANPQLQAGHLAFVKIQSRISTILESMAKSKDMEKAVVEVRHAMQDMLDTLHPQLVNGVEAGHCSAMASDLQTLTDDDDVTSTKGKSSSEELETAISHIYNFVMNLSKVSSILPGVSSDGDGLTEYLKLFSAKYTEVINGEINLVNFVLDASHVLREATPFIFNVLRSRSPELETGGSDCIDKIVLPENKGLVNTQGERYSIGCSHFSDSASDPDIPSDGNLVPTSESSRKCSLEEFEQLKMDKDNLVLNLARCTENFESTKSQLLETEQVLADVKSQLTSAQKSNSLAETQLKCMAESYRSLETRAEELQTEVNLLQGQIENLDNQLQEEKRSHQDALTRCNDLLKEMDRIDSIAPADIDEKTNQEKELADAAEKLAVCQETIFLLGKQFNSLRPQTDMPGSPNISSQRMEVSKIYGEAKISGMNLQDVDHPYEMDPFNAPFSPSDSEANNNHLISPVRSKHYPQHRPTKSGSSSAASTPPPEKQNRGLSRFFSSKGKD